MALPPTFLDELRARTPLSALIGRKTRLAKSGRNWKGCCPFHNEKTPSFYVYDDHFHCFGCGAHGDAVTFVMQSEGAGFMEAVERLAAEAGLEVPKPSPAAAARERKARDLHTVLALAAEAFQRRLRLPEGRQALDYLRRRGLTEETITRFGLGRSGSGRGALLADLKHEGVEPAQLIEAGLMKEGEAGEGPRNFFFDRVMFPIRDRRGRVIAFGGRTLGDGQPKYVNSPETALFRKRACLFGLDLAREAAFRGARLVVVEGYMDVIALHQAGFGGAVAPLGTALTPEQLQELWRLHEEPVLCFDGDAAGARAAARAAETALPLLAPERSLHLAALPAGEDPDALVQKNGRRAFEAVLKAARPLSDVLYGLLAEGRPLATPEQRAALRHRLAEAAGTISDKALAAEYRRALLDRFFAATRSRWGRKPPPRLARPVIAETPIRLERARILLALLIRHPWLIPRVEERLVELPLPEGAPTRLKDALLGCCPIVDRHEAQDVLAHLAELGLDEELAWARASAGLPFAAPTDTQPREIEEVFWHFYLRLRGEADLLADQREAQQLLAESPGPAAQQRLIRITEALTALRTGDDLTEHA